MVFFLSVLAQIANAISQIKKIHLGNFCGSFDGIFKFNLMITPYVAQVDMTFICYYSVYLTG
jgi:hypothetical protein